MTDPLHPQTRAILDKMAALEVPAIQDLSTKEARDMVEKMSAARRATYAAPEMQNVDNTTTGPGYGHVAVRTYRTSDDTSAPAIVFYHGGGHVFGSLNSHDTAARFLAHVAGCTLVSVDYRMGPEHPFPAAVDDAYAATRWVADHANELRIDPTRLAVCGDSAGANLAAVVALMARDSGDLPISAQALVYPVVDYTKRAASYDTYGKGYGVIETATVDWCRERYIPDEAMQNDWRVSPAIAPSHANLPPALVLTAECDVLHDEGVAYAKLLNSAGTSAEHAEFPGMIHGFFGYLGLVDDTERAHHTVADFLHKIWGTS